jgi:molecular chaperone GrpE
MLLEKAKRGLFSKGQWKDMSDDTIKSASELAAERAAKISEAAERAVSNDDASAEKATPAEADSVAGATPGELQGRIASLGEELEASKDRYLRLVAEFDNFRRRNAREYAEIRETAQGKALQGLFPVVDNFERALQDVPAEGDWIPADPGGFAKGVRLIRDQLRKILSDAGLEEVPGEGTPFDPNLHEALTQMPHDSVPADHVAAVHARGWKKGDKVLRHAQVIVSSGPAA